MQGRAIQATELGDPAAPLKLLVVGVIHGNETAGRAVVRALVAQEAPPRGRPLDDRRPEPGWVAAVTRQRLLPCITIWFHQPLGLVDESGGSLAVERRYARATGLPLRRLPRYHGSASSWQNTRLPGTTAFVVELPPGTPTASQVARYRDGVVALTLSG